MQLRGTRPRLHSASTDNHVNGANSSRYKMLNAEEKKQEINDVNRMIKDLETQRSSCSTRYRRPKCSTSRPATRVKTSITSQLRDESSSGVQDQDKSRRRSSETSSDEATGMLFRSEDKFQLEVLHELRKLKEAQWIQVEALERVEREKTKAQQKARHLEKQLRKQKQQQQVSKEEDTYLNTKCKVERYRELLVCESSDSEDKELEMTDSKEETSSLPPPYWTIASPATSPFQRTSGWPAWTSEEAIPPYRNEPLTPSGRRLNPSRSRSSQSVNDLQASRRSCAFFEEKERLRLEAEQVATEAAERVARACNARAPEDFLQRQARAEARKEQQRRDQERQRKADLARRRPKAREVPKSTYVSQVDVDETEQQRKERIRQRAQTLMQAAALPPRMALASERMTGKQKEENTRATGQEEAKKKKLKTKKDTLFFLARAAERAALQARKEARRARLRAKEAAAARERAIKTPVAASIATRSSRSERKPTKTETLRRKRLDADAAKERKAREREEKEADERRRRQEQAARQVRAQVERAERLRRENYAGELIDLKDVSVISKEKAQKQRQEFQEAMARNKAKWNGAAAARPSLMERFSIELKREAQRRAALETVVKTVFQKELATLKGVLTEDEHKLARDLVAADED